MRRVIPALFLACVTAVVASCASSGHTASAPPDTVTATVTAARASAAAPPTAGSTSATPATTPTAAPSSTMSAAAVVQAYYAAINAGDFQTAWNLGGDNLDPTYTAFVDGFSGTAHDALTVTGSQGDSVSVSLDATQSDGSVQTYTGTYSVSGGHITSGQLTAAGGGGGGGGQASPTTSAPAAPIMDPHGGYYRAGEFCPNSDKYRSTVDANGNQITCVYESGGYHWSSG